MAATGKDGIILRVGTDYTDAGIKRAMRDLQKLQAQVGGPAAAMQNFGKSLQNAGQKVGAFGRTLTASVTLPLVAAGAGAFSLIQKASDLQESISKVGVIFGTSAGEIEAWSKTSATALGQSQQQALDAASTFATFGKSAGLTGGALVDFSTGLTQLSADLASFFNASPEEAIGAIGAALRGEAEPIRRFGVLLDDATLKAEALALGIADGKTPLTQQQKVLAAQSAILKQTSDAQGDFNRTSDGLANQQRILRAELENVGTQLGTALLPIAQTVVAFIRDEFVPRVEDLVDKFTALPDATKNTIAILAGVAAAIGPVLVVLGPMISGIGALVGGLAPLVGALTGGAGGIAALGGAIAAAAGPVAIVVGAIAGLVAIFVALWRESEAFRNAVTTAFGAVRDAITAAVDTIKGKLAENQGAIDALRGAFQLLGDLLATYVIPFMQTYLVGAISGVAGVIGMLIDYVGFVITALRDMAVSGTRAVGNLVLAFAGLADGVLSAFGVILDGAARAFGWVPGIGQNIRAAASDFANWRASSVASITDVGNNILALSAAIDSATRPRTVTISVDYQAATEAWAAGMAPQGFTYTPPSAPAPVMPVASGGGGSARQKTPWEQFVEDLQTGAAKAKAKARLVSRGLPRELADAIVGREGFRGITDRLLKQGRDAVRKFVDLWLSSAEGRSSVKSAVDALVERAQAGIDKLKEKSKEFAEVQGEFLRNATDFGKVSTFRPDAGVPIGAEGITENLRQRLTLTRQFFTALTQLRGLQLSRPVLLDILRLGPAEGLPYAQAILAGGKSAVDEINSLTASFRAPSAGGGLSTLGAELVTGGPQPSQDYSVNVAAGGVQITVNGEITAETRREIEQAVVKAFRDVGRESRTRSRAGVR